MSTSLKVPFSMQIGSLIPTDDTVAHTETRLLLPCSDPILTHRDTVRFEVFTDVSEESIAFIFRVEKSAIEEPA
jgi:hypothetical protein